MHQQILKLSVGMQPLVTRRHSTHSDPADSKLSRSSSKTSQQKGAAVANLFADIRGGKKKGKGRKKKGGVGKRNEMETNPPQHESSLQGSKATGAASSLFADIRSRNKPKRKLKKKKGFKGKKSDV